MSDVTGASLQVRAYLTEDSTGFASQELKGVLSYQEGVSEQCQSCNWVEYHSQGSSSAA
jgi:hypothetical protein